MKRFSFILLCGLIPIALKGEVQDTRRPLLQQMQEHFALREGRTLPPQHPTKCSFSLVARIRTLGRKLTDEEKQMLHLLQTRPTCQTLILSANGHFRIHFDTTGTNAGALFYQDSVQIPNSAKEYADSVAEIFETVWEKEIAEMGYPPTPSDDGIGGDDAYDIYIKEYGGMAYGETYPDSVLNPTDPTQISSSFIMIDNDFYRYYSKGLNGARVTAAHEFFHAIQIGNYRLWLEDASPFFYEISSTWMEDEVFPAVKDYLQYVRFAFSMTDIPLNEANGLVEYGRAIFAKYLEQKFGRSVIREIWNAIHSVPSLQAIILTLQNHQTSLESEYPEFAFWHYYTGPKADLTQFFPDGYLYPEIKIYDHIEFIPPTSQSNYELRNLAFKFFQVAKNDTKDTATLIATNVNIVSALNNATDEYPFSYLIQSNGGDETFTRLSNGLWIKLQANDPQNWKSIAFINPSIIASDDPPYPNPFIADGMRQIVFPIWIQTATDAELAVYSSDLREIYYGRKEAKPKLMKNLIYWDGVMNNGLLAPSGVYYYVITVKGETRHGKIAILQK